jgi:hypothetical protein
MLKWFLRILYFIVIAVLSLQVYGYGYFQQLEAYYKDNLEPYLEDEVTYMEGMNTLLGLSYFSEDADLFDVSITEGDIQYRFSIRTVGAVTEDVGVDGYAMMISDINIIHEGNSLERPIIKMTVEMTEDTFLVDGNYTNIKTLIYDIDNPFSFQNIPVFFMFDYDGYNVIPESESFADIARIEILYGWVNEDVYEFSPVPIFLATQVPNNEAALYKTTDFSISNDYRLMQLFENNRPDDIQIATYNLNTTRDDINTYSYILTRIIVIFLFAVFVVTYFLFFHGSVMRYYKKKKAMRLPKNEMNQSIFKD